MVRLIGREIRYVFLVLSANCLDTPTCYWYCFHIPCGLKIFLLNYWMTDSGADSSTDQLSRSLILIIYILIIINVKFCTSRIAMFFRILCFLYRSFWHPLIFVRYKKFDALHAMTMCEGSWGIAPLILNLGKIWLHTLAALPARKAPTASII
jgi:hypothetical protein